MYELDDLPPHRWLRNLFSKEQGSIINLPPHRWLRKAFEH
ncbi:hypothetical protein [uncultured Gammaproteobacteria bacterium]|nr:hypothetical protein [uncultured Gammaproteobacteria bacterium]